jgi:hypothetical protein
MFFFGKCIFSTKISLNIGRDFNFFLNKVLAFQGGRGGCRQGGAGGSLQPLHLSRGQVLRPERPRGPRTLNLEH